MVSAAYLVVNFMVSEYTEKSKVFYLDWTKVYKINPFSPLFSSIGFCLIAISVHLLISAFTQTLHGRFESDFGNESKYE